MIIDIINESFLTDCYTDVPIDIRYLIGKYLYDTTCFNTTFDFNTNLSSISIGITSTSGVNVESYYTYKDTPQEPAFIFPIVNCDITTVSGYYPIAFYDLSSVTVTSGIVCSGVLFDGSSYIKSSPFFVFTDSYTMLLNVNSFEYISSTEQDNLFLYLEGISGNSMSLGYLLEDGSYFVSVGFKEPGGTLSIYNTGVPFIYNEVNQISIRGDVGAKLRIGCRNKFVEIDKATTFLGSSIIMWLGGKSGVGNFKGIISDGGWC